MTYNEFEKILLDVEINLNNCLLTYIEDDIQLNVLTPNSMTAIEMNKQRNKDMYKTVNITRGLNGNMNI